MQFIKIFIEYFKQNRNTIFRLKLLIVIIINIWFIIIFWKIIVFGNLNNTIINNNVALNKFNMLLEPVLSILGLDVLSPSTLKLLIITSLILLGNLAVLYFSQMMAFLFLGITARYSYKAYSNYIDKDTLNYYGFEKVVENLTDQEKTAILNKFIQENEIKDVNAIGYLQNKINTLTCNNQNELILNINNNWLDYKQQILSKIILHQKEQMDQIEIMNKKASSWSWESIDYWTLIKIGGGIIIVTVIIIGGYNYFNQNTIKTAGEIGNVNVENTQENSLLITQNAQKEIDLLKKIQNEQQIDLINVKNDMLNNNSVVIDIQTDMKKIIELESRINDQSLEVDNKILHINKMMVEKGSITNEKIVENIQEIHDYNINTQSLNELEFNRLNSNMQEIKTTVEQLEAEQESLINVTTLITQEFRNQSAIINLTYETAKALLVTFNLRNVDDVLLNNPANPHANDRLLAMIREFRGKISR